MITSPLMKFDNLYAWLLLTVILAAFISLFFSLQLGFFILLFATAAWWIWLHPEEGFLLLLIIAPILPLLKITQTISTFTLLKDVIIITLFFKTFAYPLLTRQLPYRRHVLVLPIILLFAWTAVGVFMADKPLLGLLRARDILLYPLLYFGVLYLPHNKQLMLTRLKWFLASLIVTMSLGVYQWFFAIDSAVLRYDPVRAIWIPRLSSTMAHPSIFGQYLVIAALFFLAGAIHYRLLKPRLIWSVLFLSCLPFIFLTYSRAVWLGLAVGSAVIVIAILIKNTAGKISRLNLTSSLLALLILTVAIVPIFTRRTSVIVYLRAALDPSYASNQARLEFLARLIAPLTNTEAIIGRGLGDVLRQNFRDTDLAVYDIAAGSARHVQLAKNSTLVDNQYLKTLVEAGIVGWLIYLALFWLFLQTSWRTLQSKVLFMSTIGLWGLGFLAAFTVQALFIDSWDIFPTNALFWITAALVSVNANQFST